MPEEMLGQSGEARTGGLQNRTWQRFILGPDAALLEKLYLPALSEAVRYDRCCAYFSSSVLSAAACGFGNFIARLIELGGKAPKPAIRLFVNEELAEDDIRALTETDNTEALEAVLLKRLKKPADLLEKQRLEMLAWLVKAGLLSIRVGVMRQGRGIVHAKYGVVYDEAGQAIVFSGSGNESASGLRANYERLEVSGSWQDPDRFEEYKNDFEALWNDTHPYVHTVTLPEAIRLKLIKLAPTEPPVVEPLPTTSKQKAAMLLQFIAEAPYLENGATTCEATAPIDLWPHQQVVIDEVSKAWPDGRMLCDEVGMGKTIQAIMVLRRLLAGRGVARALLLLPAGLTTQWQEELREKGGLIVPRLVGLNKLVWPDGKEEDLVHGLKDALDQNLLIMSRETARTENNSNILLAASTWDLVLMDEAHAARRGDQEEGEFNSATLLLGLLRKLQANRKARGFLLLSATPMQTSPWEPWDLLAIIGEGNSWLSDFAGIRSYYGAINALTNGAPTPEDARRTGFLVASDEKFPPPPNRFPPIKQAKEAERRLRYITPSLKGEVAAWLRKGSPLTKRMHRNTRKTLRQYYKLGLLSANPPTRLVVDILYNFHPVNGPERRVYNAVTEYIERRFTELEVEKPGKGFVMTIYRRRAASSPEALKRSLLRRLEGLRRVIVQKTSSGFVDFSDLPAALGDEDLPDGLDKQAISSSLPSDPEVAKKEAEDLQRILEQLKALGLVDSKLAKFFDRIRTLSGEGRPTLIFTEYSDTMEYLRDNLAYHYGEKVASYSGDGGAFYTDKQWIACTKKDITDALRNGLINFLVCTDAASEGLNLQSASALINYDLPWNPSKVEQRIGRIDRIGQREKEIYVYNFFLENSVDQIVYGRLRERCGLFEHFVGNMQPVLARAQTMLTGGAKLSVEDLERIAKDAESNFLNSETYIESAAVNVSHPPPAASRGDILEAFDLIKPEFGLKIEKKPDSISIKGLPSTKEIVFGLDDKSLDADTAKRPLTAMSEEIKQIAEQLNHSKEPLPLVVGSYREGAFRRTVAYWVGPNGMSPITSFAALQTLLTAWDGALPPSKNIAGAIRHAQKEAKSQVLDLISAAKKIEEYNYSAQRKAAELRLTHEVARLLRCLAPMAADLNAVASTYTSRTGLLQEKIKKARNLLSGRFDFTEQVLWETKEFVEKLSPNEVKSRLSGSSLEAAMSDYRLQIPAK